MGHDRSWTRVESNVRFEGQNGTVMYICMRGTDGGALVGQ
jgi:hypothetical protein